MPLPTLPDSRAELRFPRDAPETWRRSGHGRHCALPRHRI